jgi:phage FluMu protein Com
MPAELVKFRCYRCNQLLAVAPSKVGAIVACPKCTADLVVPGAESPPKGEARAQTRSPATADAGEPAASSSPLPGFFGDAPPEIPSDVADLRPEDLRVEAEFFANLTRKPLDPDRGPVPNVAESTPPELTASRPISTSPPIPQVATPVRPLEAFSVAPEPAVQAPVPAPIIPAFSPAESVVPPIEIETTDLRAPATEPRIVHEVVLPASVVLLWSLFVLAAIALSFLAGLLVGHFLWKTT